MALNYGENIILRVTPEDISAIKAKMEKAGVKNRSAYIRKMARDGYIIVLDLSDVKEVLRLLRINSNNLNQYAKKANQTGHVFQSDIEELKRGQEEIWDAVKEILTRLSNLS